MVLVLIFLCITDPHKENLSGVTFQCLRITPVFDLPYGRVSGFVIFQFYYKRGLICRRQRQEYDISESMSGGQLPDQQEILTCKVILNN